MRLWFHNLFQRGRGITPDTADAASNRDFATHGGVGAFALLTLCGVLSGCAHYPHVQTATSQAPLPLFKHLPHYLRYRMCDPFSREAVAMLQARGIPSRRIFYEWRTFGARGVHAAVLFQFNGKLYFVDNERTVPRVMTGKTDLSCAYHVTERWDCSIRMVNGAGNRIAPRKISELFAPPPEWMKQIQTP